MLTPVSDPSQLLIKLFFSLWPLLGLLLIIGIVGLGIKIYGIRRLTRSGIHDIDRMQGDEFEKRLEVLFKSLGYQAKRTNQAANKPDYGVDLVIEKFGVKTAVQAKRWKGYVGEDAVRQVYSGKNIYNCIEAMVVTNSFFSRMARDLAKSNNVRLWDRNKLIEVLLDEKNT